MLQLAAFFLPAAPLLALLAALLLGRYPGHEALVRLSDRLAARKRPRRAVARRPRAPRPPRSFAPNGGLLLALGLSGRAPPLPA